MPSALCPFIATLKTQAFELGGNYRITGLVTELGVPGPYRIRLYDRQTGRLHSEHWSASDGSYTINNLKYVSQGYYIIAFDEGDNPLNAAIADYVTPEPM